MPGIGPRRDHRFPVRASLSLRRLGWLAPAAALALAIVAFALALRFGVFVAAGADAYGYVSQADLWARGQLRVAQPIVLQWPKTVTDDVVAPLGYRPARTSGSPAGSSPRTRRACRC